MAATDIGKVRRKDHPTGRSVPVGPKRSGGRPVMALGTWSNITVAEKTAPGPNGRPRGTGQFQARARVRRQDGTTRQMARTGGTEQEARNLLHKALQAEAAKVSSGELDGDTLFSTIAERYLARLVREESAGTKAESTCAQYRHHIESHWLPRLGALRMREVGVALLEDAFDELADDGYAPASLRNMRAPLSACLALAVRLEAIPRNPAVALGRIMGKTAPARALTPEEIDLLLGAADEDKVSVRYELPDLIRFMLGTGMRIGEVLALTWEDLELLEGRIHVRHNVTVVTKLKLRDGKTAAAQRILPMTNDVAALLADRWARDGDLVDSSAPVFWTWTQRRGDEPARLGHKSPANVRRALRRLYGKIEKLGWIKQPTHVFRKTVATDLRRGGASDLDVADILGHEDVSTAQEAYQDRSVAPRGPMMSLNGLARGTAR